MKMFIGAGSVLFFAIMFGGCSHVKGVTLPVVVDSPRVWVSIESSNDNQNGVYRCADEGGQPVCTRAKVVVP